MAIFGVPSKGNGCLCLVHPRIHLRYPLFESHRVTLGSGGEHTESSDEKLSTSPKSLNYADGTKQSIANSNCKMQTKITRQNVHFVRKQGKKPNLYRELMLSSPKSLDTKCITALTRNSQMIKPGYKHNYSSL